MNNYDYGLSGFHTGEERLITAYKAVIGCDQSSVYIFGNSMENPGSPLYNFLTIFVTNQSIRTQEDTHTTLLT